jgi:hypothetical protein
MRAQLLGAKPVKGKRRRPGANGHATDSDGRVTA